MNVVIVADVIAVVILRRLINRRQPNDITGELLDVVELFDDAANVADTVTCCIFKAFRINLIDDCFFPPWIFFRFHFQHHRFLLYEMGKGLTNMRAPLPLLFHF